MTTPILGLTELVASQAQPELIVNRALRLLEAVAQLTVLSRTTTAPPGTPADGDRYIVPHGASGVWATHAFEVALRLGTDWVYIVPKFGWIAGVDDESIHVSYTGDSPDGWLEFGATGSP